MNGRIEIYETHHQILKDVYEKIVGTLYQKQKQEDAKVFLFSGCSSRCGNTMNCINIAVELAKEGFKTVLIDCDLRKGMKYSRLNQEAKTGLSDFLTGRNMEAIYHTTIENLDYIPSGKKEPYPGLILSSDMMRGLLEGMKEEYDYVILDCPCVSVVEDAVMLKKMVDGVFLVAAFDQTSEKEILLAKEKMQGDQFVGVIANKLEIPLYKKFLRNFDYYTEKNLEKMQKKYLRGKVSK